MGISDLYRKFKPYTKVQLCNLIRKTELNGMNGQVVHPSCAVSPCPPGCILVRLETGREIACKPRNLSALQTFHVGPQQAGVCQADRLQAVLRTIKLNVDSVTDSSSERRDKGGAVMLDDPQRVQGGIGHML